MKHKIKYLVFKLQYFTLKSKSILTEKLIITSNENHSSQTWLVKKSGIKNKAERVPIE